MGGCYHRGPADRPGLRTTTAGLRKMTASCRQKRAIITTQIEFDSINASNREKAYMYTYIHLHHTSSEHLASCTVDRIQYSSLHDVHDVN